MSNYVVTEEGVVTSHQDEAANHFVGFMGEEEYPRIKVATDGLAYGPGDTDVDVKLYRDGANTLRTDSFLVSGGFATTADSLRIVNSKTPSSATDTGDVGQICWDADYLYICIAPNSWRRFDNATW